MSKANLFELCHGEEKLHESELLTINLILHLSVLRSLNYGIKTTVNSSVLYHYTNSEDIDNNNYLCYGLKSGA